MGSGVDKITDVSIAVVRAVAYVVKVLFPRRRRRCVFRIVHALGAFLDRGRRSRRSRRSLFRSVHRVHAAGEVKVEEFIQKRRRGGYIQDGSGN